MSPRGPAGAPAAGGWAGQERRCAGVGSGPAGAAAAVSLPGSFL